jgi:hypothetical protein
MTKSRIKQIGNIKTSKKETNKEQYRYTLSYI